MAILPFFSRSLIASHVISEIFAVQIIVLYTTICGNTNNKILTLGRPQ